MSLSDKFKIIIPPQDVNCNPEYIRGLANGDKEAFAWIYKNYCRKIFDYAMLITGSKEQGEDVVQEVFIKLWKHRAKLKEVKDFNGYLYMLYKNHVMDVLRRQRIKTVE